MNLSGQLYKNKEYAEYVYFIKKVRQNVYTAIEWPKFKVIPKYNTLFHGEDIVADMEQIPLSLGVKRYIIRKLLT
jgi:hypothetical protein